jgi:hypothetical protein
LTVYSSKHQENKTKTAIKINPVGGVNPWSNFNGSNTKTSEKSQLVIKRKVIKIARGI